MLIFTRYFYKIRCTIGSLFAISCVVNRPRVGIRTSRIFHATKSSFLSYTNILPKNGKFQLFWLKFVKFWSFSNLPLTWKMSKWGTGSLAKIVTLNSSRSSSIILITTWINWSTIWPTFNLSNFDLPLPCDVVRVGTKTETHLRVRSTIRSYV